MPIHDVGFTDTNGSADNNRLITYGPTIEVIISHLYTEESQQEKTQTVYALIDTGARETCIDNDVAKSLGLPVVDVCQISGAGGMKEHPVYTAHIYIPALERYQYGRFAGVDLISGGQEHGALLGRTFLQGVIMIYDGLRAQVTLASHKVK